MRRLAVPALAAAAVLGVTTFASSQNENLDFKLINRTGVEIYSVYVAPHDSDDWGDDVMGKDTLPDGESVDIEFHPKSKAKIWDLRIEDKDGQYVEWENFDLTKIDVLTIRIVKGKAVAEWK